MTGKQGEILAIIELIKQFICISSEDKKGIITALEVGPPFLPEFTDGLEKLFELEEVMRMERLDNLDTEISEKQKELLEETRKMVTGLQKFWEEFVNENVKIFIKLENDLRKVDASLDKDVEKIIHEQGENAEIDAIRNSLKK